MITVIVRFIFVSGTALLEIKRNDCYNKRNSLRHSLQECNCRITIFSTLSIVRFYTKLLLWDKFFM